jgi:ACS family hexuronate transporter-like MFS transporter
MQTTSAASSVSNNSGAPVSGGGGFRGISTRAWVVVFLCGLAGMLFYMDRQTLSVLKTTLKGEMGWTDTDYGFLVSAFMACYTVCYLFTGRWIDRWGTRICMPLFIGLMSAAMVLSGLAGWLGLMASCGCFSGLPRRG